MIGKSEVIKRRIWKKRGDKTENKDKFIALLLLLITFCIVISCNQAELEKINAESKGDEFFYDETKGKVFLDLSENFDFKIGKWNYYYDDESLQDRILLSIAIKNKTGQEMDDFVGIILLNKDAADLIASGILIYDIYEPYDLIPEETANGVIYAFDILVERDEWLEEINADKNYC